MSSGFVRSGKGSRVAELKRVGLIVPSSNITMEREFVRMLPTHVSVHSARVRMKNVTPEELRAMVSDSLRAAQEVADAKVDVIGFGCTIAAINMGVGADRRLRDEIERKVGTPTVVSATAVELALKALGARRIAVMMPYTDQLARLEVDYFGKIGFEVVDYRNLNIASNIEVGLLDEDVVLRETEKLRVKDSDAVLLSCAQMPSAGIIRALEEEFGKPVVSTNTATLWAMLRLVGDLTISGYGRLLEGPSVPLPRQ